MKVREAIEKLLQFDMDAELVMRVCTVDKDNTDNNDEMWVPVGSMATSNGSDKRRVTLDCPLRLEYRTEVLLKEVA